MRRGLRKTGRVPLVVMLAAMLATALLWAAAAPADGLPRGIMAVDPRPAPLFELADMDGERYRLRREGGWRFVHFWASWCGPCRREMPALARALPKLADMGIEVVIINTGENEDTVFEFLAAVAPHLPSLLDTDGSVTEAWRPRGLPATFLVDPRGDIRYLALGGRPWDSAPYLAFLRGLTTKPPAE